MYVKTSNCCFLLFRVSFDSHRVSVHHKKNVIIHVMSKKPARTYSHMNESEICVDRIFTEMMIVRHHQHQHHDYYQRHLRIADRCEGARTKRNHWFWLLKGFTFILFKHIKWSKGFVLLKQLAMIERRVQTKRVCRSFVVCLCDGQRYGNECMTADWFTWWEWIEDVEDHTSNLYVFLFLNRSHNILNAVTNCFHFINGLSIESKGRELEKEDM